MTLALFLSSLLLGLSIAAPIGPVNLAAIRTGFTNGAIAGWMVGLGAATIDATYLLLAYAGITPLLLRVPLLAQLLAVAGAALLAKMAWTAARAAWRGESGTGRVAGRDALSAYLWGLGVTALNPPTIAFWISVGGAYAASHLIGLSAWSTVAALVAVGLGAASWFSFLALVVALARPWVEGKTWFMRLVNAGSGCILLWFAASLLLRSF
jgi:L-lysine exporter family protein LysE/ArgO